MHLSLCLLISVFARTIFALSPSQIIDSLDTLTVAANKITPLLNEIVADIDTKSQDILKSKELLDQLTTNYVAFANSVATNPGEIVCDQSVSSQVGQVADTHSKAFSTMGIALTRVLPTYNKYGYYVDGCNDGVAIGLHAITLFTDLAVMFPRDGLALLFSGLLENLRVPLVELSAVGCFVPLLGPLPLR
ncbi:hypothetical protein GGX14DRAFT_574634 [Mycena pura]|uniref:Uncharacterized protein n=1 Tax=Mycena pura TaxID=153505 RepID=A0AAD6UX85_9AGAR|nr:hypothetical protein GGX14DRAFT_574634 [Mycena pura]